MRSIESSVSRSTSSGPREEKASDTRCQRVGSGRSSSRSLRVATSTMATVRSVVDLARRAAADLVQGGLGREVVGDGVEVDAAAVDVLQREEAAVRGPRRRELLVPGALAELDVGPVVDAAALAERASPRRAWPAPALRPRAGAARGLRPRPRPPCARRARPRDRSARPRPARAPRAVPPAAEMRRSSPALEVEEPLAGEPGQLGDAARLARSSVSRRSRVPSRSTTQSCRSGSAWSFHRKASSFPSGDQAGAAGRGPEEGRAAGDDALQGERERGLGAHRRGDECEEEQQARPCAGHPPMLRSRPGLGKREIGAEHRTGRSDRDRDRLDGGCGHLRGAVHDPAPRPGDRVRSPPRLSPRRGARDARRAGLRHPRLGDAAGGRELRLREPRSRARTSASSPASRSGSRSASPSGW